MRMRWIRDQGLAACLTLGRATAGAAGVAQAGDIIALFAPAASATTPQLRQFIKYKTATAGNPNYVATGAGTYTCARPPASPVALFSVATLAILISLQSSALLTRHLPLRPLVLRSSAHLAWGADKNLPLAPDSPHIQQNNPPLCRFQLLNYRTDMAFALLHNGTTSSPAVSAISAPIAVANPNEPTGEHLTLTTDPACAP